MDPCSLLVLHPFFCEGCSDFEEEELLLAAAVGHALANFEEISGVKISGSNSKFRRILRRSSDHPNCQKLLIPLSVRLSEPTNFEFGLVRVLID
jgi:hypothetical protein